MPEVPPPRRSPAHPVMYNITSLSPAIPRTERVVGAKPTNASHRVRYRRQPNAWSLAVRVLIMPHPDNSIEIEKVRAYIATVEGEVNDLNIVPRPLDQSVFDSVV